MSSLESKVRLFARLSELGFSYAEATQLRRISMTLSRWSELECGDGNDYASWAIERDETTDKPYMVTYPHQGETRRSAIADKEKGALKRLASIMATHPELVSGRPARLLPLYREGFRPQNGREPD